MSYSTRLFLTLSSLLSAKAPAAGAPAESGGSAATLSDVLQPALQRLQGLVEGFLAQPVSPARTQQFEQDVQEALRELGRCSGRSGCGGRATGPRTRAATPPCSRWRGRWAW